MKILQSKYLLLNRIVRTYHLLVWLLHYILVSSLSCLGYHQTSMNYHSLMILLWSVVLLMKPSICLNFNRWQVRMMKNEIMKFNWEQTIFYFVYIVMKKRDQWLTDGWTLVSSVRCRRVIERKKKKKNQPRHYCLEWWSIKSNDDNWTMMECVFDWCSSKKEIDKEEDTTCQDLSEKKREREIYFLKKGLNLGTVESKDQMILKSIYRCYTIVRKNKRRSTNLWISMS